MPRPTPSRWLTLLCFLAAPLCMAETEARRIGFRLVELPGGGPKWLEIEVEVEYRRDRGETPLAHPGFLDKADARFEIGIETRRRGRPAFAFYAATAHLAALEEGDTRVRFYLPPEIVERDEIRGEPHSYRVVISREGVALAETRSPSIQAPPALESFARRVEAARADSDGILLPQNLTPFYALYPRETPGFRAPGGGL